ncbi:MAG: transcription antitermination factor NusB [Clostridia bacterium]|nr:transcription antitermination factor NusB [Clostridia bacterium]
MSRREARTAAVKIIFEYSFSGGDSSPSSVDAIINDYMENLDDSKGGASEEYIYLCDVVRGTISHISEIDGLISACSKDWSIERLCRTDLSILRVAVYEIKYRDDIPDSVSINEAVELAKKYCEDDSPSFINGVLGGVYKMCKM